MKKDAIRDIKEYWNSKADAMDEKWPEELGKSPFVEFKEAHNAEDDQREEEENMYTPAESCKRILRGNEE